MSKITVIRHRSAGNDSVGSMWHETYEFDETATLKDVIEKCNTDGYAEDIIIPAKREAQR